MYEKIFILLKVFFFIWCLQPENLNAQSNGFEPLTEQGITLRQIYEGESKIRAKYIIRKVDFRQDSIYVGDGFGQTSTLAAPALPIRIDRFELPLGCDSAEVRILNSNYIGFSREITPGRQIFSPKAPIRLSKYEIPPINVSQIVGPEGIVTVSNIETSHGKVYVNICIRPCQYDSESKKLIMFTDFEYIVLPLSTDKEYDERDDRNLVARKSSFKSLMNRFRMSPVEGDVEYIPDFDAVFCDLYKSYLIITCDDYYGAALDFAQFKKEQGYNTMISSRTSWTENQAKDTVQSYYNKYKDLEYVLILGAWKDIPGRIENHRINNESYSVPTDYYFGCIDSRDTEQDIYIGRIPVKNTNEAYCVIDKIKQYFFSPSQSELYYDYGVHVADFGDSMYNWDGYVKNSEECRDIVMKYGKHVRRSYIAHPSYDPSFFVDYSDDNNVIPIPDELKRPNFSWNADAFNIADSINKGCFYVMYRGHGDTTQWWRPKFDVVDLPLLKNNPTVFINSTCLTGKYSMPNNDCFAEGLLKHKNGGAIAVLAAGVPTDRAFNEMFVKDILNTTLKRSLNPTDYPEETFDSTLGKMLMNGFTSAKSKGDFSTLFHQEAYQIFGDPSMMMWTKQPEEYSASEVWYVPSISNEVENYDEIIINVDREGCYVSIYDYKTDESYLIYGTRMSFPYFDPQRYKMIVYGINRAPLVVNNMPYNPGYHPSSHFGSLKIYPNPADSFCDIEYNFNALLLNLSSAMIRVTSFSTGDVVKEIIVTDSKGTTQLNVSDLATGYYIVNMYGCNRISGDVSDTPIVSAKLIVDHYK